MDDIESLKLSTAEDYPAGAEVTHKDQEDLKILAPDYFRGTGSEVKDFINDNPLVRKILGFPEPEEGRNQICCWISAKIFK